MKLNTGATEGPQRGRRQNSASFIFQLSFSDLFFLPVLGSERAKGPLVSVTKEHATDRVSPTDICPRDQKKQFHHRHTLLFMDETRVTPCDTKLWRT